MCRFPTVVLAAPAFHALPALFAACALLLPGCDAGEMSISDTGGVGMASCAPSDATALTTGFEADLTPTGCQYYVVGYQDDDTVRLVLDVPAFATVAEEGSASVTYTLPDDTVHLRVEVGCDLDATYCTADAEATPLVDHTYSPTAGTVAVDAALDPASETHDALATITFTGVVLADEDGDSVSLDGVTWTDVRLYSPALD
jgi:hypothetical protein